MAGARPAARGDLTRLLRLVLGTVGGAGASQPGGGIPRACPATALSLETSDSEYCLSLSLSLSLSLTHTHTQQSTDHRAHTRSHLSGSFLQNLIYYLMPHLYLTGFLPDLITKLCLVTLVQENRL